jgi:DnaJ-domain-containing protein 1
MSRNSLRQYQWLCLEHVREFNKRWDYFQGMAADEIEAHRRDDVTWSRPTWPMGLSAAEMRLKDPFELLHAHGFNPHRRQEGPPRRPPTTAQGHAQTLGLELGFTIEELKRRYKALAKKHHPDLHGGDRQQEERLKEINAAYTWLLANPEAR